MLLQLQAALIFRFFVLSWFARHPTIILTGIAWQTLNRSAWNFCTNIHNPEGLTSRSLAIQQTSQSLKRLLKCCDFFEGNVSSAVIAQVTVFPLTCTSFLLSKTGQLLQKSFLILSRILSTLNLILWVCLRGPSGNLNLRVFRGVQLGVRRTASCCLTCVRWPQVLSELIKTH